MKSLPAVFSLIFFTLFIDVEGQALTGTAGELNRINAVRIESQRSIEYSVKIDSCLIFVSDFPTTLTLPLGKTFEWKIPAGTKLRILPGKYFLTNDSAAALEFKLTSIDKCTQQAKEINK